MVEGLWVICYWLFVIVRWVGLSESLKVESRTPSWVVDLLFDLWTFRLLDLQTHQPNNR